MAKKTPPIQTIRAYDLDDSYQGYRVLVDRLWPRGVKKETLRLDHWAKELAPTTKLRQWFDHDVGKWDEFRDRYTDELSQKKNACQTLLDDANQDDANHDDATNAGDWPILLIYAAKDEEHNHALVLQEVLERVRS